MPGNHRTPCMRPNASALTASAGHRAAGKRPFQSLDDQTPEQIAAEGELLGEGHRRHRADHAARDPGRPERFGQPGQGRAGALSGRIRRAAAATQRPNIRPPTAGPRQLKRKSRVPIAPAVDPQGDERATRRSGYRNSKPADRHARSCRRRSWPGAASDRRRSDCRPAAGFLRPYADAVRGPAAAHGPVAMRDAAHPRIPVGHHGDAERRQIEGNPPCLRVKPQVATRS